MGFNITADGKYRFSGDWRYFAINQPQKNVPEIDLQALAGAYALNHLSYALNKAWYQKYGRLLARNALHALFAKYGLDDDDEPDSEKIAAHANVKNLFAELEKTAPPPRNEADEFLEDAGGLSDDIQEWIQAENLGDIDAIIADGYGNLGEPPAAENGKAFRYICQATGYTFQLYGCDELYLFHDPKQQQACIRLVYS